MIEMASFLAATQCLNAAIDFAQKFREMSSDRDADELVSSLLSQIVDAKLHAVAAQSELDKMANRVRELDKELRAIKDFRRDLENYDLQMLGETAFAYVYRPSEESESVVHWICSACCLKDRKSMLQFRGRGNVPRVNLGLDRWVCPECSAEILVPGGTTP